MNINCYPIVVAIKLEYSYYSENQLYSNLSISNYYMYEYNITKADRKI